MTFLLAYSTAKATPGARIRRPGRDWITLGSPSILISMAEIAQNDWEVDV